MPVLHNDAEHPFIDVVTTTDQPTIRIRAEGGGNPIEVVGADGISAPLSGGGGSQTLDQTLGLGNDAGGHEIIDLADPTTAQAAATKAYTDAAASAAQSAAEAASIAATALDPDGTMAADSDTRVPSQKAVVTYVAAHGGSGGGLPIGGTTAQRLGKRSGTDGDATWLSDPFIDLANLGAKADGGTTENGAIINSLISGISNGGVATLRGNNTQAYVIKHPIIIPDGVTLRGTSATVNAACQIGAHSLFPHTTVSGTQTTPSSNATTFTLIVASTADFPMGSGGIALSHGIGVICVYGCTIFYTGVTGTTFTGCQTNDVNVTIPDGAPLSTFMIWLCEPGVTNSGYGCRLENLKLAAANIAGIGAIGSQHIQQHSGVFGVHGDGVANFGLRIESCPMAVGNDQPVNYELDNVDFQMSSTATNSRSVGIDLYDAWAAANKPYQPQRGGRDLSVSGGAGVTILAAMRLNGVTGNYTGLEFEAVNTGLLIGDQVVTQGVVIDTVSGASSGFANAIVEIANKAGNQVEIRNAFKTNPAAATTRVLLKDDVNGASILDARVDDYLLRANGSYRINGRNNDKKVISPLGLGDLLIPTLTVAFPAANDLKAVRVEIPFDGWLHDVSAWVDTSSGNVSFAVYDTGDAASGTYTQLATSGALVCGSATDWQTWDPALKVTGGQQLLLALTCDNTTAKFGAGNVNNASEVQLPPGFLSVVGGALPKLSGLSTGSHPAPATIAEVDLAASGSGATLILIARVAAN